MANRFCISCGTVTIDTNVNGTLILLVRSRQTGEVSLPKGRKDVGESLQQAAERETYEETGFQAKILPMRFKTLATSPIEAKERLSSNGHCEPMAVTGRETDGVLKLIYWFIAFADSTVSQAEDTQQPGEDFETLWVPAKDASSTLSWQDDREVADEALRIYLASNNER